VQFSGADRREQVVGDRMELSRTFVGEPMAQRGVEAGTDIRTLRRDLTKNIAVDSISLSVLRYGSASRD
jgi:hypothetical protein